MPEHRTNQGDASRDELPSLLAQRLRRLRDEPLETATHLAEDIGARAPTSLAEAQAAAYLNGRLRLAGLRASVDAFSAPASAWDAVGAAILGLVTVLLYGWLPIPALIVALIGLALALFVVTRPDLPLLALRRTSQNVVGTLALGQATRRRVVLLAPLDTPPALGLLRHLADGERALVGRAFALALLLLAGLAGLWDARPIWWYLQLLALAYLLLLALAEALGNLRRGSAGAVSHSGALAALLAAAEQLRTVEELELWLVGLGATASAAGMNDLLRRYPFERASTLFIALEGVGSGKLAYVTREGLLRLRPADAALLRLAGAADAADQTIDAEPRAYRHAPTVAGWLRRRGCRSITITCLGDDGQVPYRATAGDTTAILDPALLERAARLAVGLVRQIAQE